MPESIHRFPAEMMSNMMSNLRAQKEPHPVFSVVASAFAAMTDAVGRVVFPSSRMKPQNILPPSGAGLVRLGIDIFSAVCYTLRMIMIRPLSRIFGTGRKERLQ